MILITNTGILYFLKFHTTRDAKTELRTYTVGDVVRTLNNKLKIFWQPCTLWPLPDGAGQVVIQVQQLNAHQVHSLGS
jgi:hypothetical protein